MGLNFSKSHDDNLPPSKTSGTSGVTNIRLSVGDKDGYINKNSMFFSRIVSRFRPRFINDPLLTDVEYQGSWTTKQWNGYNNRKNQKKGLGFLSWGTAVNANGRDVFSTKIVGFISLAYEQPYGLLDMFTKSILEGAMCNRKVPDSGNSIPNQRRNCAAQNGNGNAAHNVVLAPVANGEEVGNVEDATSATGDGGGGGGPNNAHNVVPAPVADGEEVGDVEDATSATGDGGGGGGPNNAHNVVPAPVADGEEVGNVEDATSATGDGGGGGGPNNAHNVVPAPVADGEEVGDVEDATSATGDGGGGGGPNNAHNVVPAPVADGEEVGDVEDATSATGDGGGGGGPNNAHNVVPAPVADGEEVGDIEDATSATGDGGGGGGANNGHNQPMVIYRYVLDCESLHITFEQRIETNIVASNFYSWDSLAENIIEIWIPQRNGGVAPELPVVTPANCWGSAETIFGRRWRRDGFESLNWRYFDDYEVVKKHLNWLLVIENVNGGIPIDIKNGDGTILFFLYDFVHMGMINSGEIFVKVCDHAFQSWMDIAREVYQTFQERHGNLIDEIEPEDINAGHCWLGADTIFGCWTDRFQGLNWPTNEWEDVGELINSVILIRY